jgi:hypothetical protein
VHEPDGILRQLERAFTQGDGRELVREIPRFRFRCSILG